VSGPRVLLVGYNGANNTGAEALLLSDIADFLHVFGPGVSLTVPTLNESNLRRYVTEGAHLRIVPISPVFIRPVMRLVASHDLVVLVEGSTYMDTWTSALLWYFLWATRCATSRGIPCIAYAVDAGALSPLNRRLVRRIASATDMIIVRSAAAAERLRGWGVTAPLHDTADNAFNFAPRERDLDVLSRLWPRHGRPVVGIAPVDFARWPVVIRLWGGKESCYRWPYYFSHSKSRSAAADRMARMLAAFADWLVESLGAAVALFCMEELDQPMAQRILSMMRHPDAAMTFSAQRLDASQMTAVLRSLDYLVTSRFHAAVLSLRASVPQIAIGHDLRLPTLYADLGIRDEFFLEHRAVDLDVLQARFDDMRGREVELRRRLAEGHAAHAGRAAQNRLLLARFARQAALRTVE
jgi:polysaccharide pyruvyl transferase WcaK-like protein